MEEIIIRSAADVYRHGLSPKLSWRFIHDGEGYGILGEDGEFLPENVNEEGEADGWVYTYPASLT